MLFEEPAGFVASRSSRDDGSLQSGSHAASTTPVGLTHATCSSAIFAFLPYFWYCMLVSTLPVCYSR